MAARSKRNRLHVSASELAEMGYCERKVCYESRYGRRVSRARRAAMNLGTKEHEEFFREAIELSAMDGNSVSPWKSVPVLRTLLWPLAAVVAVIISSVRRIGECLHWKR